MPCKGLKIKAEKRPPVGDSRQTVGDSRQSVGVSRLYSQDKTLQL